MTVQKKKRINKECIYLKERMTPCILFKNKDKSDCI